MVPQCNTLLCPRVYGLFSIRQLSIHPVFSASLRDIYRFVCVFIYFFIYFVLIYLFIFFFGFEGGIRDFIALVFGV